MMAVLLILLGCIVLLCCIACIVRAIFYRNIRLDGGDLTMKLYTPDDLKPNLSQKFFSNNGSECRIERCQTRSNHSVQGDNNLKVILDTKSVQTDASNLSSEEDMLRQIVQAQLQEGQDLESYCEEVSKKQDRDKEIESLTNKTCDLERINSELEGEVEKLQAWLDVDDNVKLTFPKTESCNDNPDNPVADLSSNLDDLEVQFHGSDDCYFSCCYAEFEQLHTPGKPNSHLVIGSFTSLPRSVSSASFADEGFLSSDQESFFVSGLLDP